MSFPQASFDDEFSEGDVRFGLIESDDDDIEIDGLGLLLYTLLPVPGLLRQLRILPPRHGTRSSGLDIRELNPTRRQYDIGGV